MQSLIYKDILNLKKYLKTILLLVIFYIILGFSMDDSSFLSGMIVLVSIMIPIASFAYDQQSNFDLYAQSLPLTRKDIVVSKYILALGFVIFGTLLSILISFALEIVKGNDVVVGELLGGNVIICAIGIILNAIIIPLIYKYGVERARIILLIVVAIPAVVIALLPEMFPNSSLLINNLSMGMLVIVVIIAAMIVSSISYVISLKMYSNKDF